MIKTIQVDAPLETLNKFEELGFKCKWTGEALEVTVDASSTEELKKFAKALDGCEKVVLKGLKLKGASTMNAESMKKKSVVWLKKRARELFDTIYICECFSVPDLNEYGIVTGELDRRGYTVHMTPEFRKG